MSYIDNYTSKEIELIVKNSISYKDFARKIGYSNTPSGDTIKMIKNRLSEYDTSHFEAVSGNNFRIKRTLILDHIKGINNDDRLENLRWVCPNCNQQLETTGSKNPNRKIFAKKYYCIDCGKEISKSSIRCISCDAKHKIVPLAEMPITREELKSLIRTKPFTQIGTQFNVTDNAVRKWCDKFNLPRRKSDIQKYSEEEWLKI